MYIVNNRYDKYMYMCTIYYSKNQIITIITIVINIIAWGEPGVSPDYSGTSNKGPSEKRTQ